MIDKYNIPFDCITSIKLGENYITDKGETISNNKLTSESYIPRSYAYCSDTRYFKTLTNYIKDVDLLYHEATFHSNLSDKAKLTFHSTSKDAAQVAYNGNVKKLLIGHFSSRYKNTDLLKQDSEKNI